MKKYSCLFLVAALVATWAPAVLAEANAAEDVHNETAYYIDENRERYATYREAYPGLPDDQVTAYVNVRLDKGFYNEPEIVIDPGDILALCNKNYRLPETYVPGDLVHVTGGHLLRAEAARQYTAMAAAAENAGVRLTISSAYRSFATQKTLYASYVRRDGQAAADRYSARAGHSEHQTGLALDLRHQSGFQHTNAYLWMRKNAYAYGFILRYPEGFERVTGYMFEPWHWRYVGIEAAATMRDEGIATYEEYCGKYRVGARTDAAVPTENTVFMEPDAPPPAAVIETTALTAGQITRALVFDDPSH